MVEILRQLLDQLRATLKQYVIFPTEEAADAVTLHVAATHAQTAWRTASRLVIKSAEKRCGKTRLLEVCRELVWNRLATGNISAPALVRSITEDNPPTILMDEADRIFGVDKPSESTEILTGILNMGFARGWPYMRWNVQRSERDCLQADPRPSALGHSGHPARACLLDAQNRGPL